MKKIGPDRSRPHFGGGNATGPSRCAASIVTLAIISLSPPSGLNMPKRRRTSFDPMRTLAVPLVAAIDDRAACRQDDRKGCHWRIIQVR